MSVCRLVFSVLVAGLMTIAGVASPSGAFAAPGHDQIVSEVPASLTPNINNGKVYAITQVGDTVVVGGTFTSVTAGGSSQARTKVLAFNATSGALSSFAPNVNGDVNAVAPGPNPGTVYLGGSFTTVNGENESHVALLNLSTGALVSGFKAAPTNGAVNEMKVLGDRLFLGGNFKTAGGTSHKGLATLDTVTGDLDPFMGIDVTEHHNNTGSGAQGAVGVRDLDITADGTRMIAIGNFRKADGIDRDQIAMISLDGSSAAVTSDWRTDRLTPLCFKWAFDTYVRGVSFSPDGSYFVVASTGGHNAGTLCDTAARFETNASGQDLQPTWVNDSGGDTLWGVTVTETAVYVGGHQRWMNNSVGSDFAGAGAVPRPGIAALSTTSGVPLKWNAARHPRGTAVYALFPTPQGLWMGSNTDWVGNFEYKRQKIAMFPLAGGEEEASDATNSIPGTAYVGGGAAANTNVLYRVNAGGAGLASLDAGPDWSDDSATTSSYRNSGSNAAGWSAGSATDATVPAHAPNDLFSNERWDPNNAPELEWDFPAAASLPLQVRLYFANRCTCTDQIGERQFDVAIDGTTVLDDFDIVAAAGDQTGTMRAFDITSDGNVDIDFGHVVENPLINGIEIVRTDLPDPGPAESSLKTIELTGAGAAPATMVENSGVDWSTMRGAFLAGDYLFAGKSDGTLNRRTFDEGTFGPEELVDPYHDPKWANVTAGNGPRTYDGNRPNLYGQMNGVRGIAYTNGRIYYTRTGSSNLLWSFFNADSGIIGSDEFTASGGLDWSNTGGMFITGGRLYFVDRSDNSLNSVAMTDSGPSGAPIVEDSPSTGGNNWSGKALFLAKTPLPNVAPSAAFEQSCVDLVCQFDGSTSSDSDGTVESYDWDFGDTVTDSGQVVDHTFAADGTYDVTLTVTDDDGATDSTTLSVQVETSPPPTSEITHVDAASEASFSSTPSVTVPATVQPGDTLLLTTSASNNTAADAPAGWTSIGTEGTDFFSTHVWYKTATAADAGADVAVTLPQSRKAVVSVSVYSGVDASNPIAASASGGSQNTSSHTTPELVAPNGAWVVSIWSAKGSAATSWTVPGSTTLRTQGMGSGGGANSTVIADTNAPVSSGTVPGETATTSVVSGRSVTWSVALTSE